MVRLEFDGTLCCLDVDSAGTLNFRAYLRFFACSSTLSSSLMLGKGGRFEQFRINAEISQHFVNLNSLMHSLLTHARPTVFSAPKIKTEYKKKNVL